MLGQQVQVLGVYKSIKTKENVLSPIAKKLQPKWFWVDFQLFRGFQGNLNIFFFKKKNYGINQQGYGDILRPVLRIQKKVCSFCNTLLFMGLNKLMLVDINILGLHKQYSTYIMFHKNMLLKISMSLTKPCLMKKDIQSIVQV